MVVDEDSGFSFSIRFSSLTELNGELKELMLVRRLELEVARENKSEKSLIDFQREFSRDESSFSGLWEAFYRH